MVCMNGGGDRSRCSPGVPADCGPVALRFLLEFPISKETKKKQDLMLVFHTESRFLFVLDAPGGLPSLLELPLPDCVAGGCQ